MASCDVIWKAILPDETLLVKFLNAGGLDAMLDLVDTGHVWYRPVILSLLCDTLQLPQAHPFFHNWQSGVSGKSAAERLLEIWREQEDSVGISDGGVLVNTARPLAGSGNRTTWVPQVVISKTTVKIKATLLFFCCTEFLRDCLSVRTPLRIERSAKQGGMKSC